MMSSESTKNGPRVTQLPWKAVISSKNKG
jgi:hypothetical protein